MSAPNRSRPRSVAAGDAAAGTEFRDRGPSAFRARRLGGEADVGSLAAKAGPRTLRFATVAVIVAFAWYWLARTTGTLAPDAAALLAAAVLACAAFGRFAGRGMRHRSPYPGIAFEFVTGFFIGNTLLFALVIACPWGIGADLAIVGAAGCAAAWASRRAESDAEPSADAERASFATVVVVGVATSIWVQDQQPLVELVGDRAVFRVWTDVFIHARAIADFADAHGVWTLSNVKLAEAPASVYHFASYVLPAALRALTATSALDAYAALHLPFGLLLAGLGAYALVAVATRSVWPAAVAAVAVVAAPDTLQQGFGNRYLSFQFMSQVNLGMLYGLACISIAWLLMIDACRRGKAVGIAAAFAVLAVCATYKAHLFVTNALILMLYPCVFFGRLRAVARMGAACAVVSVFLATVALSQRLPRVPTLAIDPTGLKTYVAFLCSRFAPTPFTHAFSAVYLDHRWPTIVNAALGLALLLVATFGVWLVATPVALWVARRRIEPRVAAFVAFVVVNYVAMSSFLAPDRRGIGGPEEFINRPHAWAYFVVVAFGAAGAVIAARRRWSAIRVASVAVAALACSLVAVARDAPGLQLAPEWPGFATYAERNSVPACLYRSARFVKDHAAIGDVIQDSRFDPWLVTSAVAERQEFVADLGFGGELDTVKARIAALETVEASADPGALDAWAAAHRVRWVVLHPEDAPRVEAANRERPVYACDGFRVLNPAPEATPVPSAAAR